MGSLPDAEFVRCPECDGPLDQDGWHQSEFAACSSPKTALPADTEADSGVKVCAHTVRPHRHLCPEADLRDAMTDGEFWAHVYPQGEDGPDTEGPEDFDLLRHFGRACEVCGEMGPCGYDAEGRPMIHTEEEVEANDG